MSKEYTIAGVDIGGTKCALSIGKITLSEKSENNISDIKIIDKIKFDTPKNDPFGVLERFSAEIEKRIADGLEIDSIGISCGGPLDSRKGIILSPPGLPGWDEIHVVEHFEKRHGIKCAVQNDANACALAEWKFGAGKGLKNIVFFTFGTGLGAGLILDGKLYSGTNDNAGEAGHIRLCDYGPVGYGKSGSFEGFCSGNGIAELGKMRAKEAMQCGKRVSFCPDGNLDSISAKSIAQKANEGFEDAKEIYRISGEYLGRGLSVIIDILNPEVIIIGSVFARSEGLMRSAMESVIEKEALPLARKVCKVVPAMLGESIGDFAAVAVGALNI